MELESERGKGNERERGRQRKTEPIPYDVLGDKKAAFIFGLPASERDI